MMNVIYAECHLCSVANKPITLSIIMLSVFMLSVFILSVLMLSVVKPNVVAPYFAEAISYLHKMFMQLTSGRPELDKK